MSAGTGSGRSLSDGCSDYRENSKHSGFGLEVWLMEPHWRGWVRVGAAGHTATEHPITPTAGSPPPPPREGGPWLEKDSSVNDEEAAVGQKSGQKSGGGFQRRSWPPETDYQSTVRLVAGPSLLDDTCGISV